MNTLAGNVFLYSLCCARRKIFSPPHKLSLCLLLCVIYTFSTIMYFHFSLFNQASESNNDKDVSFWGDIESEKGGSDLIFEPRLDDQTTVDLVWIKRVIMHCMEVLFYKEKWEKLVGIIFRFNALSRLVIIQASSALQNTKRFQLHHIEKSSFLDLDEVSLTTFAEELRKMPKNNY